MGTKRIKLLTCLVAVLPLVIGWGTVRAAPTLYVDATADGLNNGSSWGDAYKFLQDALADAQLSTEPVEIRVAQGLYRPDQGRSVALGDRDVAFVLTDGISILGGFAGVQEPDPNARDVDAYPTVLSGDLQEDDLWWVDMAAGVPEEVTDSHQDNSECIVDAGSSGPTAILDGLHIKGLWYEERSLGRGETINLDRQGGLFVIGGSPTILNCVFTENLSCSVKNVDGGNPTFTGCRFVRNHYLYAPAILTNSSDATISECTFEDNVAVREGGAMVAANGQTTITDSVFRRNVTSPYSWEGGGAILNWWSNSIHLIRCDFYDNSTEDKGGALSGGDVFLEDCTFHNNCASSGGAVFAQQLIVEGCDFCSNTCENSGGAIWSGAESITNSTFMGNRALYGGAMRFNGQDVILKGCVLSGNEASGSGGAVHFGGLAVLTLDSCTLDGNRAAHGNAIRSSGDVVIKNSVVWDANAFFGYDPNTFSISYSNLHDAIEGLGNISVEPAFALPGYWDPNDTPTDSSDDIWIEGDYHLQSQAGRWDPNSESWVLDDVTSPCIDAGDPNDPVGDEPLPNGDRVNMGAYGGTAEASISYFEGAADDIITTGDISSYGKVDWADFGILASYWICDDRTSHVY